MHRSSRQRRRLACFKLRAFGRLLSQGSVQRLQFALVLRTPRRLRCVKRRLRNETRVEYGVTTRFSPEDPFLHGKAGDEKRRRHRDERTFCPASLANDLQRPREPHTQRSAAAIHVLGWYVAWAASLVDAGRDSVRAYCGELKDTIIRRQRSNCALGGGCGKTGSHQNHVLCPHLSAHTRSSSTRLCGVATRRVAQSAFENSAAGWARDTTRARHGSSSAAAVRSSTDWLGGQPARNPTLSEGGRKRGESYLHHVLDGLRNHAELGACLLQVL